LPHLSSTHLQVSPAFASCFLQLAFCVFLSNFVLLPLLLPHACFCLLLAFQLLPRWFLVLAACLFPRLSVPLASCPSCPLYSDAPPLLSARVGGYIYIYLYLSIYLSVCLSIYLFIYLSIYLSVYLSIYLSLSLSPSLPFI
jgi:hypothetical protein